MRWDYSGREMGFGVTWRVHELAICWLGVFHVYGFAFSGFISVEYIFRKQSTDNLCAIAKYEKLTPSSTASNSLPSLTPQMKVWWPRNMRRLLRRRA